MQILIIDDSTVNSTTRMKQEKTSLIKKGKALLEQSGHKVIELIVSDPTHFISEILSKSLVEKLKRADVLLIDKDFSVKTTSTRVICAIRHNFPQLPIVYWGGHFSRCYDRTPYINYPAISELIRILVKR